MTYCFRLNSYVIRFWIRWTLLFSNKKHRFSPCTFTKPQHLIIDFDYTFTYIAVYTRRNATIPWKLKGAIQSHFSHHSVDWIAGTFQLLFSAIQSPFRRLSVIFTFLFPVYYWSYMHYFFIYLMLDTRDNVWMSNSYILRL